MDERRARALEEPLDVRLRAARPYPLLEVRNPVRGTAYLVMLPEYPARDVTLCTCTDFARRGLGTCKHIEAALRWLPEHPEAKPLRAERPGRPLGGVWRQIDRRIARELGGYGPESRRWREAGAVLFERDLT